MKLIEIVKSQTTTDQRPPVTIASYESWLRSLGLFELANANRAGDRFALGAAQELANEEAQLPWYAGVLKHELEVRRVAEFLVVPVEVAPERPTVAVSPPEAPSVPPGDQNAREVPLRGRNRHRQKVGKGEIG